MDRFMNIKEKLIVLAEEAEDIKAIVLIGSSTRDTVNAEEYSVLLEEHISHELNPIDLSEPEFVNMVNDFFFHTIWASKKILRGELWTAKMCMDAYLKISVEGH